MMELYKYKPPPPNTVDQSLSASAPPHPNKAHGKQILLESSNPPDTKTKIRFIYPGSQHQPVGQSLSTLASTSAPPPPNTAHGKQSLPASSNPPATKTKIRFKYLGSQHQPVALKAPAYAKAPLLTTFQIPTFTRYTSYSNKSIFSSSLPL